MMAFSRNVAVKPVASVGVAEAWAGAFLEVMCPGRPRLSPLTVSITDVGRCDAPDESPLRHRVDEALATHEMCSVADTAFTIFPIGVWTRRKGRPRSETFDRYAAMLPRIQARRRANQHGTYFARMTGFEGVKADEKETVNQLDHLLEVWARDRGNGSRTRPLALQVGVFDPPKDHDGSPRRGFPCLQQIGFDYDDEGGLAVNAFYPTQYVFDRGYGNYLGLCHLGHFMATEMGLSLVRVNCFVGSPRLSGESIKRALVSLRDLAAAHLQKAEVATLVETGRAV